MAVAITDSSNCSVPNTSNILTVNMIPKIE